jgi:hypothetical protein
MPYRHYKGGAYLVTGVGRFEADMTPVVVYESMRDRSLLWVRHADVFTEPVSTATGDVARFAPHWAPALSCLDFLPRKTVLQVLALYDAPYRKYHDRRHVLEMFEQPTHSASHSILRKRSPSCFMTPCTSRASSTTKRPRQPCSTPWSRT